MKPAGFIIDVPISLSVEVRGTTLAEAKRIAQKFAEALSPSAEHCSRFTGSAQGQGLISRSSSVCSAMLAVKREISCSMREELPAERINYTPTTSFTASGTSTHIL